MDSVQNIKKISKTQVFKSPYNPAVQPQASPDSHVKTSASG